LNRIQEWLEEVSLFRGKACAYIATRSTRQRVPPLPAKTEEATMDIFKGLLFLQGYVNATDFVDAHARQRYGAATLAGRLAEPLGNRSLSRRWFGAADRDSIATDGVGCVVGSCG
jgi:hypothetical protein